MSSHLRVLLWVAAILTAGIFFSGCADKGAGSQPPVTTLTLPPTPVRPTPVRTTEATPPPSATTLPVTTTAPVAGPGTIAQQGSILQIAGPVSGMKGTGGNYIDLITFDLVKIPRVDPVNMENVQVTLTRYSRTTGLRYEITGRENANSDSILEEGETFSLAVFVKPDYYIYLNDRFELRVLPPGSAAILVQSQVPASLEQQNILVEP